MISPCAAITAELGGMFVCEPHDDWVRVRTPFLYPDGDAIDVYVADRPGGVAVTDLGESMRWLRMQTTSARKSPRQRALIHEVCAALGVELSRGMLVARSSSATSLTDAVMRLSQASLRVADIWFTMRNRMFESATDDVAEFLTERSISFERSSKFNGMSGRSWIVDFRVRTHARDSLVNVLSTGSRASARGVVEHHVAMWLDISRRTPANDLTLVSLFDDDADVWTAEDFVFVGSLSTIARWSKPDEFEEILSGAA